MILVRVAEGHIVHFISFIISHKTMLEQQRKNKAVERYSCLAIEKKYNKPLLHTVDRQWYTFKIS